MDITRKVIAITGRAGAGPRHRSGVWRQGAVLALIDVNRTDLEVTEAEVRSRDGRCAPFVYNVASEPEVEATFAAIGDQFGALHGSSICAGILRDGMLIKVKEGDRREDEAQGRASSTSISPALFLCGREGRR